MSSTPTSTPVGARRLADLIGETEDGTFYRVLAARLRELVLDGRLAVGTRLPSERELAAVLGRSRSSIVAAYGLLRESGFLQSRQGSGSVATLPARARTAGPIDLAHAVPAPIEGLAELVRRATSDVERMLDAPALDLVGDGRLRERIAAHYEARGLRTDAGQVLVTVGGQHAIGLAARARVRHGDHVLMDTPCYPHAYEAFQLAGARVVTTPVTTDGWDLDHLVGVLERTRPVAAYVMPDFQNPTGASMSPDDRVALCRAAARSGTTLVVDETTAGLGIDRGWDDGPFARHAAATGCQVVTVGSLSKSIWGGLRLGWLRAEPGWLAEVARRRSAFDLGTPRIEQLVAAEVVPELPRLLPLRSRSLREGRDVLASALTEALPGWAVPVPHGGLSLWVRLDRPVASSVSVLARSRGLAVSAGPRFSLGGSHERFLRLPYTEAHDELRRGVGILREVWSDLSATSRPYDAVLESVV